MDEDVWISMVSRAGRMVQVRGGTALEAGDEVLALASDSAWPPISSADPG